jgi:hypothetical protein
LGAALVGLTAALLLPFLWTRRAGRTDATQTTGGEGGGGGYGGGGGPAY